MFGRILRIRGVASRGTAKLVSVQSRSYGSTPLKTALRVYADSKPNEDWNKQMTTEGMVVESNGCLYLGPFTHILHDRNKKWYKDILNGEYLVPTESRFGGVSARGMPGRLTAGRACGFEYFVALQQVGKGSHSIGGFVGFQVTTDRPRVPIIITATTNESGALAAVDNTAGADPLKKDDIHKNFADLDVHVDVISGQAFDES